MFSQFNEFAGKNAGVILIISLLSIVAGGQQSNNGTIRGKVVDAKGALIVGANVIIIGANGAEQTTQTNQEGLYSFGNLAAGKYTIRVSANGFAPYENSDIDVAAGKTSTLDVALSITLNEQVNVGGEQVINTDSEANASAIVLKEDDIKVLPDNRTDLEAALQALAGPGAGPNGGEIFIDGFSGGRLPPRDSIREIRVNQNPFSSEYDRLGLGPTGRFNQNQLLLNFRSNFIEGVSLFGNYAFGGAKSDTDGAGTFPANQYDLSSEYGNSLVDIRHRFVFGGNFDAPLGISLRPFISFRSGIPFNITTGTDSNGDTLFTERPSFAASLSHPGIIITKFGAFNPTPVAGETIIPRNYGRGPEFFIVNLTLAKEFGFGGGKKKTSGQEQVGDNRNRTGTNSPFGGGGQRGGDEDESPYKLELSMRIRNLFNRTNGGTPIGNLRSPFFGEPVSLAGGFGFGGGRQSGGNRQIRFELQFSF